MESLCNLNVEVDEGQRFLRYVVSGERYGKWGKMHFSLLLKIIKLFLTLKTYVLRMCQSSGLKGLESWHKFASAWEHPQWDIRLTQSGWRSIHTCLAPD